MTHVPLCHTCIHNLGDGCTQSIQFYPSRCVCTSHKLKDGVTAPAIASCEFKVYSEITPGKMIKYAYLP